MRFIINFVLHFLIILGANANFFKSVRRRFNSRNKKGQSVKNINVMESKEPQQYSSLRSQWHQPHHQEPHQYSHQEEARSSKMYPGILKKATESDGEYFYDANESLNTVKFADKKTVHWPSRYEMELAHESQIPKYQKSRTIFTPEGERFVQKKDGSIEYFYNNPNDPYDTFVVENPNNFRMYDKKNNYMNKRRYLYQ